MLKVTPCVLVLLRPHTHENQESLPAMDRRAVRPALASACELLRQVGNSQDKKLNPVP